MTFDTVVGQSALTDTLKNSVKSGHLAHAYLFCGPRGVGKTTCARIFAKTINCMNPGPDGEACGECESCKAFNEQRSLNIHELDAASNNGIEEMKALIEQTRIPPQVGKYKVFIIDEVHMLSTAAFNAFLKTLEEPPHYVVFILATTEKHKLLPTILSRCQIYDFNRMNVNDIVRHLTGVAEKEGIQVEPAALNVIAEKADGGMRDALSIFDQVAAFCNGNITYEQTIKNLNVLDYEYYFHLVDYFLEGNIPKVMTTLNDILNKGFEASHFIGGLNSHLRNLMMSRDPQTLPLIEASDSVRQKFGEQAKKCKPQFLYAAIRRCTDCDINYKASQNKRLLVEITLIEIAQMATEDIPYSGRSPKRILKQLFKSAAGAEVAASTAATNQVAASSANGTAAAVKSNVANQPVGRPAPAAVANPLTAKPVQEQATATVVSKPRMRGFSISQLSQTMNAVKGAPAANENAADGATLSAETSGADVAMSDQTVRPDDFIAAWRAFAAQLPREEATMATRLENIVPTAVDDYHYEVMTENPLFFEQVKQLLPDILVFVRRKLHSDRVEIDVKQRLIEDRAALLTRSEQFAKMKEMNAAFKNLVEELNLDLV